MIKNRGIFVLGDALSGGGGKAMKVFSTVMQELLDARDGAIWSVYNLAQKSQTTTTNLSHWTNRIRNRYPNIGTKYLVFYGGINDHVFGADNEAAQLTVAATVAANYQTLIDNINADGGAWKGLLSTPPFPGISYGAWTAARRSGMATHANSTCNLLRAKNYGAHCTFLDIAAWTARAAGDEFISQAASGSFTANGVNYNKLDYLTPANPPGGATDNLHLNDNYHTQIAQILLTYIR